MMMIQSSRRAFDALLETLLWSVAPGFLAASRAGDLRNCLTAGMLACLAAGCGDDRTAATTLDTASATDDASGTTAATTASSSDSTSASGTSTSTTGATSGDSGIKFDVPSVTTGATGGNEECGCGNDAWSYIWIANSGEHTVSKINTRTLVEEGRYYTREDQSGNPSRTSVSIDGRAVVVANRFGGVTKIWARPDDCVDKNNNGMIDTSVGGSGSMLPFNEDECIAWHSFVPDTTVQRPVAWTSGTLDPVTCEYEDQKVWTATGRDSPPNFGPGFCGATGTWVHRLNGDTGAVEDTFHIPNDEVQCTFGSADWGFGYYGGAVVPENNLWLSTFSVKKEMVKVEYDTLDYTVFSGSKYGVTVDTKGRPWVGDTPRRFDEGAQQWEEANPNLPGAGGAGIAEDHQGRMWTATENGVGWVDVETLTLGDTVTLPMQGLYRGISVDIDGFIWAVRLGGQEAFKIDPDTYTYEMVGGLNAPYTYSDMTGGQLSNVTCTEPEG